MRGLIALGFAAAAVVLTAPAHDGGALRNYSACTARAALRLDDGRPDYAPVARAVAAACRDSYRAYASYMERHNPSEPLMSDRALAISAVQYERKFGPPPLLKHRAR
ncbi:MAG TPA: hypothetical protein VHX61_09670 [Rhizomicrobium sp.]|jgi:hypothetical protein|nr:hypothetical protein [Rhizomicrobium sp.]